VEFEEKEKMKKFAMEEENFLRRAKEAILSKQKSQHPFALNE